MRFKDTQFGKIPAHWNVATIDSIAQTVTDYVANGSFASLAENVQYREEEDFAVLIRLVDYNNNFSGNFVYIDKNAYNFLKKSKLYGGEVIISNVGANVGTVFRCPFLNKPMSLAPNSIMVKFNDCDDFYYYWLKSPSGQYMLHSIVTGSAQPKFNKTNFRDMMVPVPPIDEQKKIASFLNQVDEKIATNKQINQNLNEQVQALFKSWFVDFEPFGGSIPLDWKNVVFADILTPVTEKSNDEKIPMYSVTDTGLFPRDKKFKKKLSMTNAKCKVIHNNDLVFGMSREILNWGVMHEPLGRVSAAYNVYHVGNDVDSFYLEHYIKSHSQYFKDLIRPASREGQGIDKTLLMEKEMYVPSKAILDRYYEIENPIIEFVNSCEEENICLESLRDTLLPRLMSGELNIANIDI